MYPQMYSHGLYIVPIDNSQASVLLPILGMEYYSYLGQDFYQNILEMAYTEGLFGIDFRMLEETD